MKLVYPRLARAESRMLVGELARLPIQELASVATVETAGVSYYPLHPYRATSETLSGIRANILGLALAHGYPQIRSKGLTSFDQELATLIVPMLEIVPGDAMSEDVWSFLSLKVLPDVTAWRYPARVAEDGSITASADRWTGHPRNAYRRLWVRGFALGAELAGVLGEDNYVAIFERPTLGGDPRVARAMTKEMARRIHTGERTSATAQEVMRDAAKRLLRHSGSVSFASLDDAQLARLVCEAFDLATEATSNAVVLSHDGGSALRAGTRN